MFNHHASRSSRSTTNQRASVGIALLLLAGCGEVVPQEVPDPPDGLAVAWAFDDCAPWDGPATTIYLAGETAPSVDRADSYPHVWVSLYRPSVELPGRTFEWDSDDKDTGGAMLCLQEGECIAATRAKVRLLDPGDGSIVGTLELTFPDRHIAGGFSATWRTREFVCG